MSEQTVTAAKIVKYESIGIGCVVQLLGVVGGVALIAVSLWPIGLLLLLGLLIYGSILSKKYLCGACRNRLAEKEAIVCPTCSARLVSIAEAKKLGLPTK